MFNRTFKRFKVFTAVGFFLALATVPARAGTLSPGDFVWKVDTTTHVVALTFDDGPGPYTVKVMELLKAYDAKATFFVLGELAKSQPDLMAKIVAEGHEPASHTFVHTNFAKTPPDKGAIELTDSIRKAQEAIEKTTGKKPRFCRIPHGIDKPWIRRVAKQEGVILVNWTFGYDWLNMSRDDMAKSYVDMIRPGAILLMHDGGRRQKTLEVLEIVLKHLKEKGYKMVTVGELLDTYPSSPLPVRVKAKPKAQTEAKKPAPAKK